ncbi:alpha-1,3-mannosyl-glycoprotein 4-beta-N-acetylglucosaminyltransferase C-like [Ylistrum balloti]|uniref:alpha-1,3-mannosyl-glycoprotein 4-beta-N-acetylglucosaminyltransferase C-like n=1 Tax=Ylistrum balloti TaxID=509963 RepID=UPI002905CFA2|nr:alpha-1,3-mannosyl-glycoprotein 4-beta-N-acetylglucosaminyltransferase C-like [Ylistrum balloti]
MPRLRLFKLLSRMISCRRQTLMTWTSILILVLIWANMHLLSCVTENSEQVPSNADIRRSNPSPAKRQQVRQFAPFEVESMKLPINPDKALLYGTRRQNQSELTIGIPTVRRNGVDYLERTLYSLITYSKAPQRKSMVVVVFMVDKNETWVKSRSKQIATKFPKLIQNGFLQIIHPHDQSIYPDFNKLKRTFNDTAARVAWRSKQNIDYAYLFSYSKNISRYYLHLEDDVIAAHNYYDDILNFIQSKSNTFWYCLEFSFLGFIGKLFRSSDLQELSEYILMFFDEQPGDLLLSAMKHIKTQWKDIRTEKSLFQHKGIVSSLTDKTQKLVDGRFKDSFGQQYSRKRFYHVNPSAVIDSKIETYSDYEPVHAYDLSDKYFWGVNPKQGDYFRLIFEGHQNISRLFIDSGEATKQSDMLHHARLLVSNSEIPCQNLVHITDFVDGDVDTRKSNISLPENIDCIVIEITANQSDWVIIREIAVFLPGESEKEAEKDSRSAQSHGESKILKWQTWKKQSKPKIRAPRFENGKLIIPGEIKNQYQRKQQFNDAIHQNNVHKIKPHEMVGQRRQNREHEQKEINEKLMQNTFDRKRGQANGVLPQLNDPKLSELWQQQNKIDMLMKMDEMAQKLRRNPPPKIQGRNVRVIHRDRKENMKK